MSKDQIETAANAAASEIQRRNKQRHYAVVYHDGMREPVVSSEEMSKIITQFMLSAQEGLG